MSPSIDAFIQRLAQAGAPPLTVNPYAAHDPGGNNARRRHNLRQFLAELQRRAPSLMLVAEAPGYRGCRLTGIPFVSPALLAEGVAPLRLFGRAQGYRPVDEWPHVQREASATIMWETMSNLQTVPLLWNAFPFHPHRRGKPQSNRAPKTSELALGRPFFTMLHALFPHTTVVAVGRKAQQALTGWQVAHHAVRHPSHGGKAAFTAGLQAIYQ